MKLIVSPIPGQAFTEVLAEMHQHVFIGVPGESDPFTLDILIREYIAFALACYYQCDHCQTFHQSQIEKERKKSDIGNWEWKDNLTKTLLFLRLRVDQLSKNEASIWRKTWQGFAERINRRHYGLACYTSLAIGIARADKILIELSFKRIATLHSEEELTGVIRDIDRVVIFMKAATSKNRTDPIIIDLLNEYEKQQVA